MIALFFSVTCSTLIFVLLKIYGNHRIDSFQAIVANYFACVGMGILTAGNNLMPETGLQGKAGLYWLPLALLLGSVFIVGFRLVALTILQNGVAVASVAGKTSLVLPVVAAFFLYGDTFSLLKIFGVVLAVIAVLLTSVKQTLPAQKLGHRELLLPASVFLLSGLGEIILNFAQVHYLNEDLFHLFTTITFGMAGIWGTLYLFYKRTRPKLLTIFAGVVLGIPNYFSIYFLLQALRTTGWQSSVLFPVNNMATVGLSALIAWSLFREKLSFINLTGILLAILAIGMFLIKN